MPLLYNLHRQKRFRQHLRNNATPSEQRLWFYVRGRQLLGLKFRRQHSIRDYVLDFYCPELRLAIEVDGDAHFHTSLQHRHDTERQQMLEALNIRVIRVLAEDVIRHPETVLETMTVAIQAIQHGEEVPDFARKTG